MSKSASFHIQVFMHLFQSLEIHAAYCKAASHLAFPAAPFTFLWLFPLCSFHLASFDLAFIASLAPVSETSGVCSFSSCRKRTHKSVAPTGLGFGTECRTPVLGDDYIITIKQFRQIS